MDINAILDAITHFFTTDLGQIIGRILNAIYEFISPSNAPGAHDVPPTDS